MQPTQLKQWLPWRLQLQLAKTWLGTDNTAAVKGESNAVQHKGAAAATTSTEIGCSQMTDSAAAASHQLISCASAERMHGKKAEYDRTQLS